MDKSKYKRILVIGATGVGKTSIISAALCGNFQQHYSRMFHVSFFLSVCCPFLFYFLFVTLSFLSFFLLRIYVLLLVVRLVDFQLGSPVFLCMCVCITDRHVFLSVQQLVSRWSTISMWSEDWSSSTHQESKETS